MSTKRQPTPQHSQPSYIAKLNRVEELKQEAKSNIYERVTLLVAIFEDAVWRKKVTVDLGGQVDDATLAGLLDKHVDDTDFCFLDLRHVLHHFPHKTPWQRDRLGDLFVQAREAGRRESEHRAPCSRRSATVKELEEAQAAREHAESQKTRLVQEATTQQSELDAARTRIGELEERVAELETENADLRVALSSPMVAVA